MHHTLYSTAFLFLFDDNGDFGLDNFNHCAILGSNQGGNNLTLKGWPLTVSYSIVGSIFIPSPAAFSDHDVSFCHYF